MPLNEQEEFELLSLEREKSQGSGAGAVAAATGSEYVAPHNAIMGSLKSAADIGSNIMRVAELNPYNVIKNMVTGREQGADKAERDASIKQFMAERSNPESLAFKGGELITDIAGTAGVPGLLGKAAQAVGAAPKVVNALQSGGFKLGPTATTAGAGRVGDAALRVGAGATAGGAAAGLANPEDATTGAVIGAALPGGVKLAGAAGSGMRSAGEHILGTTTGTSAEAVRQAFNAGKSGATDFLDNMRGKVDFGEIVDQAKQGLRNMRDERGKQYRSGMVNIKGDKSILDMTPIVQSVRNIQSSGNFKGKVINEKAAGTIKEIADKVNDWAGSKAAEFHTPEGLDALKQAIGDIRDDTAFGTPARRHADEVYNAIKAQIQKQAPEYEKVMKDYSRASEELSEITKALSLGEKGSKDTAIRKLQSLMRNNVQTNYGNRTNLAKTLQQKGGVELEPAIAGQAMSAALPRGMVGALEKVGMVGAAALNPGMLALAPATSPRLVGEALYGAGRVAGAGRRALSQLTGRPAQVSGASLGQLEESSLRNPALRNALIQAMARREQANGR